MEAGRAVKRIAVFLSVLVLLALLPVLSGGEDTPEPTNVTMSGKVNLEITGMTYETLTLVNSFNVDLINCSIKNLVLVRCWNVDVTNCEFVGEGVAAVADSCLAVAFTGCKFGGGYSQRLMSMRSARVRIE